MARDMRKQVESRELSPDEITAKQCTIYDMMLRDSAHLGDGNFTTILPDDLEHLFDLNDALFFDRGCRQLLGDTVLEFRLSKRMTQAGGKASCRGMLDRRGKLARVEYEIAVASSLLFQTFQEDHRPVVMSGIDCRDRLEALQRVMEHEMTHLIELLLWQESSCSAGRFQSIANRFFGHTDHRHQLITPRERAFTKFGIKTGDHVSFRMDGQHYVGIVNRITKRATVLVEDQTGQPYSNGKRYTKFYIPVGMLQAVTD